MSFSPFDGVVLDDLRPPIPGARAMLLHLEVDRALARRRGRPALKLEALRDRAGACRELLAHGLLPAALGGLGLAGGDPRRLRSLASLTEHLQGYLAAVEASGHLEPDAALWAAVDAEREGRRGLWIERGPGYGALDVGLAELRPARLRVLASLPGVGPVRFRLATRRGGGSGLFGSSVGISAWLLEGVEGHGQAFGNPELDLDAPPGWAESSPWSTALEGLFEGPLDLDEAGREALRRGLVDSPIALLRACVEQVRAWVSEGIAAAEITVVHPAPEQAATLLEPLLAAEGIGLQLRGALRPLILDAAWASLWALLEGLWQEDPARAAAGLAASTRGDLKAWAETLAGQDQVGLDGFGAALAELRPGARERATATLDELKELRAARHPAREWARRLGRLAYALRLPVERESFFGPLALLEEAWGRGSWAFPEMLEALQAFLETATDPEVPRRAEGLRLLSPGSLLEDWGGCRAALVLDLSEGAWPAAPRANPDLDWERRADINRALLRATQAGLGDPTFPPALQRFWLPTAEHDERVPRGLQLEAYAFNALLALTRERLVALSPGHDAEGRALAQGPFWNALEGCGEWRPDPQRAASTLRFHWDGGGVLAAMRARAEAAQARSQAASLLAQAPGFDRVPGIASAWMKGREAASPTALEGLARCPFRSLADRAWGLSAVDAKGEWAMARGSLAHALLEELLRPLVGSKDWPTAFREQVHPPPGAEAGAIEALLEQLWTGHREAWLRTHARRVPAEQHPALAQQVEALLPNLARYLAEDLTGVPRKYELCLRFPDRFPFAEYGPPQARAPRQEGWTRELLGLELELGPWVLELGGGRSLAIAGKVDRLERFSHPEHGGFLRVTDYKTAAAGSLRDYAEDEAPFTTHLQLPLYLRLAEALLGEPATGVLVPLKDEDPRPFDGPLRELAKSEAAGRPWRGRLEANLGLLAGRLERGDFPPTPGEHCRFCNLAALCGRPVDVESLGGEGEA